MRPVSGSGLRATSLAGAAIALAGAACLVSGLAARPPSADWLRAIFCATVGATLIAIAGPSETDGWYAGVIERATPTAARRWALRAAVVLTSPLAGLGVLVYALAALGESLVRGPAGITPIDWRRSAGVGMAGLAAPLAARAAGLQIVGSTASWAILLIGAGLALFWGAGGMRGVPDDWRARDDVAMNTGLGLVLAVGGAGYVLSQTLVDLDRIGPTAAGTATSLAVLALVVGPRWLRTRRLLEAERMDRMRAEERSEMAAHLHDSVLQTLALIQRRAEDPATVASLAHRQERDLRDWLLGRRPSLDAGRFADALRAVAADVEDAHGAEFELVIVGDARVDGRIQAVLDAAREALVNTARHAAGAPVSVFARADDSGLTVYVRDRGPGFDPEAVGPEHRGIPESIVGRMERQGGEAEVRSEPGGGCEVILTLPHRP
jgi:signal transduction histidine kinase